MKIETKRFDFKNRIIFVEIKNAINPNKDEFHFLLLIFQKKNLFLLLKKYKKNVYF